MGLVPQVRFQNLEYSEAVEHVIVRKIVQLQKLYPRLAGCRVVVDAPHRGKKKGRIYFMAISQETRPIQWVIGCVRLNQF